MGQHIANKLTGILLLLLFLPIAAVGQDADSVHVCAVVVDGEGIRGINEDTMCTLFSVVKFPQAIYVAHCLSTGGKSLTDTVLVEKSNLMSDTWSPMLSLFGQSKYFSYAELLRLSLQESDNNACDILFDVFGGPSETERYITDLGFTGIRIGATERQQMARQAAQRNAASPKEIADLLEWFYLHHEDNPNISYVWLLMAGCNTGRDRIARVLSGKDTLINKTGTGFATEVNDAGIALHQDGSHSIIVVFVSHPKGTKDAEKALRDIVRGLL